MEWISSLTLRPGQTLLDYFDVDVSGRDFARGKPDPAIFLTAARELGVVYYRDSRGTEPVDEFIQALPPKRAAKIDDFVEEYLNGQPPEAPPPAFPITPQIEGELRELRVRFANTRYRILYQRSENLAVLLHALEKDTGAVPPGDIELAKQRMADFKRRMDAIRRKPPRAAGKDAPPARRPV